MANIQLVWVGLRELEARFVKAAAVVTPVFARELYQEATDIIRDTIPITPIQYGNLRASGHVEEPVVMGDTVEVQFGFGGAAAPYAVYVHEILDNYHAPPTQAKFLETTVIAHEAGIAERLNLAMGDVL